MKKNKLYFIGYGHMAEAIYQRLNKSTYENIFLIEKDDDRRISIDKKNSIHMKGPVSDIKNIEIKL